MTDKELIKQEIERRIENLKISLDKNCVTEESKLDIRGNITTLNGLLKFIDSLPEEPTDEANCTTKNEDLEEYYKNDFLPKEWFAKPGHRTISQFNFFTAHHFAEWSRKQMMKDAIKGEIGDIMPLIDVDEMNSYIEHIKSHKLKSGDKVKIIIVKED